MTSTELSKILTELVAPGTAAGAAVITPAGASPVVTWVPEADAREPGFLIYSITKTILASIVMLLVEEGRLALDDAIAIWVPDVPGAPRISVRQLLNHTAGNPDYGGVPAYHEAVASSPSHAWTADRFGAETFGRGLAFEPGTSWSYSNPGYMLVKQIAERAAGVSFANLVSERIARPLELSRTFVVESVPALAPLAPASSRALSADGTPRDVRHCYDPHWVSHGVVASTPSNIACFIDALASQRIVSRAALAEMTTLVRVPIAGDAPRPAATEPSYGLGIMADPASPYGLVWGHNGGGPGYSASAFHACDLRASVCAMIAAENGAGHVVDAILCELARQVT